MVGRVGDRLVWPDVPVGPLPGELVRRRDHLPRLHSRMESEEAMSKTERMAMTVNESTPATYDEKTEHLRVVAERGADARKLCGAITGWPRRRAVRVRAEQVWDALSVLKTSPPGYRSVQAMQDTPPDGRTTSNIGGPTPTISRTWAAEVRRTFITAFCAAPEAVTPQINSEQ
ncbi:hypothetical protein [Saccharopolyspora hattusasensis]|uniref:hypothetical protein n=1 Tax=Saccharopolyspora hattusasensis TaxID=1128679 RepID=UPI003D982A4F